MFFAMRIVALFLIFLTAQPAKLMAWGARGHEVITLVANRLLAEDPQVPPALSKLLLDKEHYLAHLANVPDTVWRQMNQEVQASNAPSHYIDLEFIYRSPKELVIANMPLKGDMLAKLIERNCQSKKLPCAKGDTIQQKLSKTGHGPLRAIQLLIQAEHHWQSLKKAKLKALQVQEMDQALLYMGLVSHFIGDLSNPLHTSHNYDGQLSSQKGVHRYFETDLVNAYPLDLDFKVYQKARGADFLNKRLKLKKNELTYSSGAWSLAIESHSQLDRLLSFDRKTFTKESKSSQEMPKRKPPKEILATGEELVLDRLAIAASLLKELWLKAWMQGGSPSVDSLHSYTFEAVPEFVEVNYLP